MDVKYFEWRDRQEHANISDSKTMAEDILLICNECPHEEHQPKYNPYTGHIVCSDFHYVCPECRGSMIPKEAK